jgi:phosphate transport system substrate-binding protein
MRNQYVVLRCFALFALLLTLNNARAIEISGAGASFPAAIYNKWATVYASTPNFNYQPVGSGAGVELLALKRMDFGASDRPLTREELDKNGLMQFPVVIGGVVPVVNIDGVKAGMLKLDGKILADIYLGKITRWRDPAILALNKDLNLPNDAIEVMYRSDASGSTFLFSNYLSKVSPAWKATLGEGALLPWKVGTGGLGSTQVVSYLQRIKNSIAYVDFNKAVHDKLSYVLLKNRDGWFVSPSVDSLKAAASMALWEKDAGLDEILTDKPGKDSWPITGATFVLMRKTQPRPEVGQAVLKFFDWAYVNGGPMAEMQSFVPLPPKVQQMVRDEWRAQLRDAAGNPLWK